MLEWLPKLKTVTAKHRLPTTEILGPPRHHNQKHCDWSPNILGSILIHISHFKIVKYLDSVGTGEIQTSFLKESIMTVKLHQ